MDLNLMGSSDRISKIIGYIFKEALSEIEF